MEQPTHPTGGAQSSDCHAVDIELQLFNAAGDVDKSHCHLVDGESHPTSFTADCHVVNVEHQGDAVNLVGNSDGSELHVVDTTGAAAAHDDGENCCVVCTEPLEWVAIGRCGHRVVCCKCMVRIRFFYGNKRCCICRTRCCRVVVSKTEADSDIMSTLPWFTFKEGRVGKYWYHRHTAAYFEDEKEYEEAKKRCKGILTSFYKPVVWFIIWFSYCIFMGVIMGSAFAGEAKHMSMQVGAYAISISIAILVGTICWTLIAKCTQNPLHIETYRLAQQTNNFPSTFV